MIDSDDRTSRCLFAGVTLARRRPSSRRSTPGRSVAIKVEPEPRGARRRPLRCLSSATDGIVELCGSCADGARAAPALRQDLSDRVRCELHAKAARALGEPAVHRPRFSQQPLKCAHRMGLEIQFESRQRAAGAQTRRHQVCRPVEPNEFAGGDTVAPNLESELTPMNRLAGNPLQWDRLATCQGSLDPNAIGGVHEVYSASARVRDANAPTSEGSRRVRAVARDLHSTRPRAESPK